MKKSMVFSFFTEIRGAWKAVREYNSKRDCFLLLLGMGSLLLAWICDNTCQSFILMQIYLALSTGEAAALYQSCALCTGLLVLYFVLVYLNNVYGDYKWVQVWLACARGGCRKMHLQPFDRLNARFGEEELVNRVDAAAMDIPAVISNLTTILANSISLLLLFGMFSSFSWTLAAAAVALVVWSFLNSRARTQIQKKYETQRQAAEDRCGGTLHDAVYEIIFSSMYGCGERLHSRYKAARKEAWNISWRQQHPGIFLDALTALITSSLRGIVGASMFPSFRSGRMQTEDVTASFSVYDKLGNVVNSYASPFVDLQARKIRIARMDEIYDGEGERWSDGKVCGEGALAEAENICYGAEEKPILKNISLTVRQGEKIALIGQNGCGKSTLLRVLAGLNEPQGGQIRRDTDQMPGHRSISYVPSSAQLYEDTAEENIRMNGDGTLEKLYAVSGLLLEGSAFSRQMAGTFSGGQAQRVNIARGLANRAPLLLADEPEAGLPPGQGEQIIQGLLAGADTAVVITHYPEHLRYFSRIILMEDGQIAVEGSLNEVSGHPAYERWCGQAEAAPGGSEEM